MIDSGTVTGTTQNDEISVGPMKQPWQGSARRLYAAGSFGGGSVKVQRSPDGGTTKIDVGTALSDDGVVDFDVLPDETYYVDLTGGTAADVDWWVF